MTSCSQSRHATKLRHTSTLLFMKLRNLDILTHLNTLLSRIRQKRKYQKVLLEELKVLEELKDLDYRKVGTYITNLNRNQTTPVDSTIQTKKTRFVYFIISIKFSAVNTFFHFSDSSGRIIKFYSAGNVGFSGKAKRRRRLVLDEIIKLFFSQFLSIHSYPVALHLTNVRGFKRYIIRLLKTRLIIRVLRIFDTIAFNGCRKRKVRRKKIRTKAKKNFRHQRPFVYFSAVRKKKKKV